MKVDLWNVQDKRILPHQTKLTTLPHTFDAIAQVAFDSVGGFSSHIDRCGFVTALNFQHDVGWPHRRVRILLEPVATICAPKIATESETDEPPALLDEEPS